MSAPEGEPPAALSKMGRADEALAVAMNITTIPQRCPLNYSPLWYKQFNHSIKRPLQKKRRQNSGTTLKKRGISAGKLGYLPPNGWFTPTNHHNTTITTQYLNKIQPSSLFYIGGVPPHLRNSNYIAVLRRLLWWHIIIQRMMSLLDSCFWHKTLLHDVYCTWCVCVWTKFYARGSSERSSCTWGGRIAGVVGSVGELWSQIEAQSVGGKWICAYLHR